MYVIFEDSRFTSYYSPISARVTAREVEKGALDLGEETTREYV